MTLRQSFNYYWCIKSLLHRFLEGEILCKHQSKNKISKVSHLVPSLNQGALGTETLKVTTCVY